MDHLTIECDAHRIPANLIAVQWQGREKLHYFNPVPIHEIYERWIRKFELERLDALHNFKTKLERNRK